jgi:hypothetical protein
VDAAALRALVLDINFGVHGVDATVTRPAPADTTPITTRAIWLVPNNDNVPSGAALRHSGAIHMLALRRDEVPTVPIGTVIIAREMGSGSDAAVAWKVESHMGQEADHERVIVARDPDSDPA